MPAGEKTPSAVELLSSEKMRTIIKDLKDIYDWIIIDSPPATSYPDVAAIAAASGGAILVVEAETTRQEVVEEAKRVLDVAGVELLGAVLNRRRYHIPGFNYKRL